MRIGDFGERKNSIDDHADFATFQERHHFFSEFGSDLPLFSIV